MSATLDFWGKYHGRKVIIDGLKCTIRVSSYMARYPYEHLVVKVDAVPTKAAKKTDAYHQMRTKLGDDWFTDVLESDPDFQENLLMQLEQ